MKRIKTPVLSSALLLLSGVVLLGTPNAACADDPIRQPQNDHLLGYSTYYVDRSWDGIGPQSGLLTRARVVTKYIHASPDFIIEGEPYTTTPIDLKAGTESPNNFGVPGDRAVEIFVRINNMYVVVDPFRTVGERAPAAVKQARRKWLRDNGYTERARIIRRVNVANRRPDLYSLNDDDNTAKETQTLPTPRATIEIHPGLKDQQKKNHKSLEASINGTIRITTHTTSEEPKVASAETDD